MMNAYAVNTPNEVKLYSETEIDPAEYGLIYEVVIAKSRSQARNIVTREYDIDYMTPLFIRKLAQDIDDLDLQVGTIGYTHDQSVIGLMVHAAAIWHGMTEEDTVQQWIGWIEQS